MYRRAHLCMKVASIAQVRLITRLKNQSEFTEMADVEGDDVEESATREGGASQELVWELGGGWGPGFKSKAVTESS